MTTRDFWVHVHGPRAADFEKVFGRPMVPVTTPLPHAAFLPGFDEPQLVYLLDLEWATEQGYRQALVEHAAERFGIPADEVDADLERVGMPILESDTSLVIHNAQRWVG